MITRDIDYAGSIYRVTLEEGRISIDGLTATPAAAETFVHGHSVWIKAAGRTVEVGFPDPVERAAAVRGGHADSARAAMPGVVVELLVAPGQAVEAGQPLVSIESMKLLSTLVAPRAGIVATVHAAPGAAFAKGAVLVTLEPA